MARTAARGEADIQKTLTRMALSGCELRAVWSLTGRRFFIFYGPLK